MPIFRSAETGKIVTKEFATANPKTTVKESQMAKKTVKKEPVKKEPIEVVEPEMVEDVVEMPEEVVAEEVAPLEVVAPTLLSEAAILKDEADALSVECDMIEQMFAETMVEARATVERSLHAAANATNINVLAEMREQVRTAIKK